MIKTDSKYIKRTIFIAWPCIFENIMVTFVTFINTIMVGGLGAAATAAVGINSAPIWLLNSLPMVFSVSGTAMIARLVGAGDYKKTNETAAQVMSMSIVSGIALMITVIFLSPYIPRWMAAEPEVLPLAASYLRIYSFSLAVLFCGLVAAGLLRGAGNTKAPMLTTLLMNAMNIVGNYFLIYPSRRVWVFEMSFDVWGAGLGVSGAALSTCLSQIIAGALLMFLVFRKNVDVYIDWKTLFKFDAETVKRSLMIGLPAAGERVSVNIGQLVFQWMVATLGTAQVAAHFLANTAEAIAYMPAFGFQVAATTLVGQSLGAEEKDDALTYGKICILFTMITVLFCSLIFFFFPRQLLGIFSNDREVIELGVGALRIVSFAEPFFCMSIVLTGILRGAGDTVVPFIAGLISMWIVRLTTAAVLIFVFDMGLNGAWLSMAVDMVVRCTIIYPRYHRKKWLDL